VLSRPMGTTADRNRCGTYGLPSTVWDT
jgi:hypothetical protein